MKKTFLILIIFLLTLNLFSQQKSIVEITGQILNVKNNAPVHYATIINLKKGQTYSCDSLGFFHVTMLKDDILRINALGFDRTYFTIKDSIIDIAKIYIIKLEEKTYKIANVNIYDARWDDFEFEFTHTEIQKQVQKDKIEKWFYSLIDSKELALLTASVSIGIPIGYKTKHDKQKIKVRELELQDIENKIIEKKYNIDLVSELTGLNIIEAKKFMKFCMFDRKYLLQANEYDIIVNINSKFKRYFKILNR